MTGKGIGKPKLYRGTACDQCFRLKTRCKGERPICGHCQKTETTCTFSTDRVKRTKTAQKRSPTNEQSAGDSPDSTSSRWPIEPNDPASSHVDQSLLWDNQLPLLHSTAGNGAIHNPQDLSDFGMDLQWFKRNDDGANDVMEDQQGASSSSVEALGELESHGDTFDSNTNSGLDTSRSMRHEALPEANITSRSPKYTMTFENNPEGEVLGQSLMEGVFDFMPDTGMPWSSTASTSMIDSRLRLNTVIPGHPPGIDYTSSDLRSSDIIHGLLDSKVKSPPHSIPSRLQFARRSLDLVSVSIECHCAVVDTQSIFMAFASIAILQLLLTCYQNISSELARPESLSVVNDFHIGAFQLEEGDMCNRVIEAIIHKEVESCRQMTRRLRSWIDDSLGEEPKENTDILSALVYGVEISLKNFRMV